MSTAGQLRKAQARIAHPMSKQTEPGSAFAPASGYATGKRNTTISDLRALVRSQNHYVQHWRSRAERAEADCAALREEREELIRIKNAAYRDYCCNGDLADGPICSLYGLWSVFGKSHNEVAE